MADKREKIAAARKKLKQYQSKQQKADSSSRNESESARETPLPASSDTSSIDAGSQDTEFLNHNFQPSSSNQPSSYGVANYFNNNNNGNVQGLSELFSMEPQVARLENIGMGQAPPMEASVHSINRISEEIGQLIANASADLGPQNTILELESEKADLLRTLNAQKLDNDELRLRLRNQQSTVEDLKNEIEKLRLENSTKVTSELGPIQEQLQSQTQAVGVLVAQNAELTASIGKYQTLVKERATENDELQNRLKASRSTVQKLEKEIETLKQSGQRFEQLEQTIGSQLNEYQEESNRFRKLYEDLQEDLAELKQKLVIKTQEFQSTQTELEQTRSDLNLARLRIDQLSSDDDLDYNAKIESLTQQNLIKQQQIKDLQDVIRQIGGERDQSSQLYQTYVLHLNKEVANLADRIQELTDENNRLASREENLVQHVGELERQLQQQISKQQKYAAQQDSSLEISEHQSAMEAEIKLLKEKVATMEVERAEYMKQNESVEQLQQRYEEQLKTGEERIAELQLAVERLQVDKPDVAKLMSEIESGKVGASRAVAQNMELKQQLQEMQRAFVQISNDKLELTDKLQTELHLGKEMKATYGRLEEELNSIREKLHYKDEEMIRLTHENTELQKQVLLHNQELDRLRHYESHANDGKVLQIELQRTQEQLRELQQGQSCNDHNGEHNDAHHEEHHHQHHHHHHNHDHDHNNDHDLHREVEILKQEKEELIKLLNSLQSRVGSRSNPDQTNSEQMIDKTDSISDNISTVSIPTHEAMEKLQQRFKRTMLEVAELTDEKQRLEHLVLQLQGETETIGEYITLYQQQRRLLKQKDMERDHQLLQLASDREKMKLKLKELNFLVHQLVQEKVATIPNTLSAFEQQCQQQQQLSSSSTPVPTIDLHSVGEPQEQGAAHPQQATIENGDHHQHPTAINTSVHIKPTETAGRILSLLSDIKEANIPYGSGVQHCSCCSGRLETV
ncbi:golgin subfamily A member 2 [Uranotaenia lowii]|uniref:golgin subfamily A member 2 n=1 Tax=Uranotaenia lowii TaxID=190385 RepID=UPI00247A8613|nr:golgin subfamily A member 2 [Uranotaenia lowii]